MNFEQITENIDKILSENNVRSVYPARLRTEILSLVVKAQIEAFVGALNNDLDGITPELEIE